MASKFAKLKEISPKLKEQFFLETASFFLSFLRFYLFERKEHTRGGAGGVVQREREKQTSRTARLDPRTLKSRPESKAGLSHPGTPEVAYFCNHDGRTENKV